MLQHFLRNMQLKPSGPGALSMGMCLIVSSIYLLSKGSVKLCKSSTSTNSSSKLNFIWIPLEIPTPFLNEDQKAATSKPWSKHGVPSERFKEVTEFLLSLSDAMA